MTRTELAALLLTTEKNLNARLIGLKVAPTCGRCGGSGNYSYNQMHGTMCYGCHGRGHVLPTAKQWEATCEAARAAVADGRLAKYIEYQRAVKASKGATEAVLKAWSATTVGSLYNKNWRNLEAFPGLQEANGRMSAAHERVSKLAYLTKKSQEQTIELAKALTEGLAEIAAAEASYTGTKS